MTAAGSLLLSDLRSNGIGIARTTHLRLRRFGLVRTRFLSCRLCPSRSATARLGVSTWSATDCSRNRTLEGLGNRFRANGGGNLRRCGRYVGFGLLCGLLVGTLGLLFCCRFFFEGCGNHFPLQVVGLRLPLLRLRILFEMHAGCSNLVFRKKAAAFHQARGYVGNGNLIGNRLAGKGGNRSLRSSEGFLWRHVVYLVRHAGALRHQARRTGSLFAMNNVCLVGGLLQQLFLAYQSVANLTRNLEHYRYSRCVVVGRLVVRGRNMKCRTHDGKNEQYRADNQEERDNRRKRTRVTREHRRTEQEQHGRNHQGHRTCLLHKGQELHERGLLFLQRLRAVVVGHQHYLATAGR